MEPHMLRFSSRLVVAASALVCSGIGIGVAVDRVAFAQQTGITRTILQQADDPGSTKYVAIMGISEIAPGATSGKHRHPGTELAYVLDGSVELQQEGKAPVTVKAGETIRNEANIHMATNKGKKP